MGVKITKSKCQIQNRPVAFFLLCVSAIACVAVGLSQQPTYGVENLPPAQAIAKLCANPTPATDPLDFTRTGDVVTANTISQDGLTNPSLWWAAEQFGGKLLENWLAYAATGETPGRIDIVVNRQLWSLLNYLERYQFVNQFGKVAQEQDYPYNIRVFNRQGVFLAAYTCAGYSESSVCSVCLDSAGKTGSLRGN